MRISDSLLALWYSLSVFLGLSHSPKGRKIFLNQVRKKYKYRSAYLYGSARSALYALLKSLELDNSDEIIITGFTCDVVPNAVINAGCKPVYADIDPLTYGMAPKAVLNSITSRTRAIIIQHTFGIPANLDALLEIANKYNLFVIEDCAVSLGSRYNGKLTGTFGDAAIFSFELSKTITSCRGGLLIINSHRNSCVSRHDSFYQKVHEQNKQYSSNILFQLGLSGILYRPIIHNMGKYIAAFMFKRQIFKASTSAVEKEAHLPEDYLHILSNQQAMILYRQWKRLPRLINNSQELTNFYYSQLKECKGIEVPSPPQISSANLIRYPIITENRSELQQLLAHRKVELGLWFTAPVSSPGIIQEVFKYMGGTCPEAERISTKVCNLPTHIRMNKPGLEKIVRTVVLSTE